MKRTLFFFLLLTFLPFASVLRAQAPQAVTLQSVLRDAAGRLVANRNVSVLISLRRGSNTGTVVYSETHTPTTNQNGLYTVFFGRGTAVTGSFAAIDWALGPYYATVEADPTGGSNYTLTVSHPIVSVPYALFADTAAHAPTAGLAGNASHADTADYYREEQRLTIRHDTIHLSGGRDNPSGATWVKLPHDSLIHVMSYQLDSLINRPCVTKIGSQNVTQCDSYTWPANQTTYTGSGVYTKLFEHATSQHCDSLALLVLTINRSTHNVLKASATGLYNWNGKAYANSGTYTYSYTNGQGCPSVDTLKVTINTVGSLPGVFSVSATKKVRFSRGNLRWRGSDNRWQFAGNQYDVIGNAAGNTQSDLNTRKTNSSWIDLFGWGTSGFRNESDGYNTRYYPYEMANGAITTTTYNYYGYGPSRNMTSPHLTGGGSVNDWGVPNRIFNGGNQVGLWRTLTQGEWNYLLKSRSCSTVNGTANARYCNAIVNGISGLLIFPDSYTHPATGLALTGINTNTNFSNNNILYAGWLEMEAAGAVFLPVTGYRNNYTINNVTYGYYWTATSISNENAYAIYFYDNYNVNVSLSHSRRYGCAVRLVQDVQ